MKQFSTVVARPIKIEIGSKGHARIKDGRTGQIIHSGSLKYIKAVASKRYNRYVLTVGK